MILDKFFLKYEGGQIEKKLPTEKLPSGIPVLLGLNVFNKENKVTYKDIE